MKKFDEAMRLGSERLVAVHIAAAIRSHNESSRFINRETLIKILEGAKSYARSVGLGKEPNAEEELEACITRALPESISILACSGFVNLSSYLQTAFLDEETLERARRRGQL